MSSLSLGALVVSWCSSLASTFTEVVEEEESVLAGAEVEVVLALLSCTLTSTAAGLAVLAAVAGLVSTFIEAAPSAAVGFFLAGAAVELPILIVTVGFAVVVVVVWLLSFESSLTFTEAADDDEPPAGLAGAFVVE